MAEHTLKIDKEYLDNLLSGRKHCEIRYNDRDYQLHDTITFHDFKGDYKFRITHVHSGLGMKEGYVALSVEKIDA